MRAGCIQIARRFCAYKTGVKWMLRSQRPLGGQFQTGFPTLKM
jgi:hypothetical protein